MRQFCFDLARELKMPVGELLDRMDSRELTEWMAYYWNEAEDSAQKALADKAVAGVEATKAKRRR